MSCPVCGKAVAAEYRPFCSRRCANLDLQKWLTGGYVLPVNEDDETKIDGEEDESRTDKLK